MDLIRHHKIIEYWSAKRSTDNAIIIKPNQFVLLKSREDVIVPSDQCAILSSFNEGIGEFRTHYAGFVDPGFSAPMVFEIRAHNIPIILRHGQRIGLLERYPVIGNTDVVYGNPILSSSYANQGLDPGKYFK